MLRIATPNRIQSSGQGVFSDSATFPKHHTCSVGQRASAAKTADNLLEVDVETALIIWTVVSAVASFVVPRGTPVRLTHWVFTATAVTFRGAAPRRRSYTSRDRIMSPYAPFALHLIDHRDQAWRAFAGWPVNNDQVLLELASLTIAAPAPWSWDGPRSPEFCSTTDFGMDADPTLRQLHVHGFPLDRHVPTDRFWHRRSVVLKHPIRGHPNQGGNRGPLARHIQSSPCRGSRQHRCR